MALDEILKYIGASSSLLWIPFALEKWQRYRPQDVYVVFDEQAHVGFNMYGSYISVRVAMCAPKSNDIVFGKYQAKIACEDGSKIELYANHIEDSVTGKLVNHLSNESFSTVRTRSDILTLLKSGSTTDKDVSFYESGTRKKLEKFWDEFNKKEKHYVSQNKARADLLNEQVTHELIQKIKAQQIWQPKKYEFTLLASPQSGKVNLKNNKFSFELTTEDCAFLNQNKKITDAVFKHSLDPNNNQKADNWIFVGKEIKQNI
jgi:hypothetical protein